MFGSISQTHYFRGLLWALIPATSLIPISLSHAQDSSRVQRVLLYDCCAFYEPPKDTLRSILSNLASQKEFEVTMSWDQAVFDYARLKTFNVVVIAYAAGSMNLSEQRQADFERYVREGGGVVSIFETWSPSFQFLRDSVHVLEIHQTGIVRTTVVYADSLASVDPDHAGILHSFPDSLSFTFFRAPYRNQGPVEHPRDFLGSAGATIVLSTNFGLGESDSSYPVVWTRKVGSGRAAVNMLGHPPNIYSQQDGYVQKLLWNLMEYVAGEESVSIRPQGASSQPPIHFRLIGRSLALSIPEGRHVMKVWDTRGRAVQTRTFEGPGAFFAPLQGKGVLAVRVQGPHGSLQKRIFVE